MTWAEYYHLVRDKLLELQRNFGPACSYDGIFGDGIHIRRFPRDFTSSAFLVASMKTTRSNLKSFRLNWECHRLSHWVLSLFSDLKMINYFRTLGLLYSLNYICRFTFHRLLTLFVTFAHQNNSGWNAVNYFIYRNVTHNDQTNRLFTNQKPSYWNYFIEINQL